MTSGFPIESRESLSLSVERVAQGVKMISVIDNYMREQDQLVEYLEGKIARLQDDLMERDARIDELLSQPETSTPSSAEPDDDFSVSSSDMLDGGFHAGDDILDDPELDVDHDSDDGDDGAEDTSSSFGAVFDALRIPDDVTESRSMTVVALNVPALVAGLRNPGQQDYAMNLLARLVSAISDLAGEMDGAVLDVVNGVPLVALGLEDEGDVGGFVSRVREIYQGFEDEFDQVGSGTNSRLYMAVHRGPIHLHRVTSAGWSLPLVAGDILVLSTQLLRIGQSSGHEVIFTEAALNDDLRDQVDSFTSIRILQSDAPLALFSLQS